MFFNKNFFFLFGFNVFFFFLYWIVIIIYDFNYIDVDVNIFFLKKFYYNIVFKRVCRKVVLIFIVFEFLKGRIVDWLGINLDKVKVVYNGVLSVFY